MKKNLLFTFAFGVAIGIIIFQMIVFIQIKKVESHDVLFKVKITAPYINIRSKPTSAANKLDEVVSEETYQVIDYFDEDSAYTWYKITYQDRRIGWIASDKETPWVIEIK